MKRYQILLLIGPDRPGIVDQVSSYLFERDCNIEDSRMGALGGQFAIMTLFSCPEAKADAVRNDLEALESLGFTVTLHQAQDPSALTARPELPIRLEVAAMDNPGIVKRVVSILHSHNANIVSLDTKVVKAPLSGAPLFNMSLDAGLPAGTSVVKLKQELTDLAAERNFDLNFSK